MKKHAIPTLCLALALGLAACSSTSQSTAPEPASSAPASSGAVSAPAEEEMAYGTATFAYAESFSGGVTSTDSFDAVTSATNSKYEIMPNMATDFVDEETNAEGYHITGVKNVWQCLPKIWRRIKLPMTPLPLPP